MRHPELKRGDKGAAVTALQSCLNRAGAMLVADGDYGPGTERGVKYAQDCAGLPQTGLVDQGLWTWLNALPEPFPPLSIDGIAFIAKEETGGLNYYESLACWPHYPGYESGITIGVGFDLRFATEHEFKRLWSSHLSKDSLRMLSQDIGKKGSAERSRELKRAGIQVPFKAAWPVFTSQTLPSYYQKTELIYPSINSLPLLCRSVLVSLVYNRGNSLTGSRRREMKAIAAILQHASDECLSPKGRKEILTEVEDQILSMQRLWGAGSGLSKRRQAEANLWRQGLAQW